MSRPTVRDSWPWLGRAGPPVRIPPQSRSTCRCAIARQTGQNPSRFMATSRAWADHAASLNAPTSSNQGCRRFHLGQIWATNSKRMILKGKSRLPRLSIEPALIELNASALPLGVETSDRLHHDARSGLHLLMTANGLSKDAHSRSSLRIVCGAIHFPLGGLRT
jgi:hypothetical protein